MTTICRITTERAQYLMMAPAVAGGWCAVSVDARNAVTDVLCRSRGDGNYASILALLPDEMRHPSDRDITQDEVVAVIEHLRWIAKKGLSLDEGASPESILATADMIESALRSEEA